jgi:hypothetical protein
VRVRGLILLLLFSSALLAEERPARERGELGVRYWLSTGETERSHNAQSRDPTLGNPTSVLLYENLDANVLELFGRQNFRNNLFVKGTLGVGRINTGSFDDEDFDRGQIKFSDTTSSVPQGRIGYGTLDLGYQWVLRQGGITLGVFAGYGQWTEKVDAYGATDHLGFIGGPISRDVKVISNEVTWKALRAGVNGEFAMGAATRLALDLAAIPYAEFRNEDSHHLRGDLGPVPNIIIEGRGVGVQLDAEVRHEIVRRWELSIGLRYWYLKSTDGSRHLPNIPGFPDLPAELYSTRTGVTASLRRTW